MTKKTRRDSATGASEMDNKELEAKADRVMKEIMGKPATTERLLDVIYREGILLPEAQKEMLDNLNLPPTKEEAMARVKANRELMKGGDEEESLEELVRHYEPSSLALQLLGARHSHRIMHKLWLDERRRADKAEDATRHSSPDECCSWHDGCNCTPETCNELSSQLTKAEARAETAEAVVREMLAWLRTYPSNQVLDSIRIAKKFKAIARRHGLEVD